MQVHVLGSDQSKSIRILAEELQMTYRTVNNAEFHNNCHHHSFKLPISLITDLAKFRTTDSAALKVRGLKVDEEALGNTPESWRADRSQEAYVCEFMHYLTASHLGQPFCWKTQQGGRTINDIVPVAGFEDEQLAIASSSHLMWHVEDAFHDARGEFLSLFCLRNNDGTPTLLSNPNLSLLSNEDLSELFKPQFRVRADDAHDVKTNLNSVEGDDRLEQAFDAAGALREVPILFGHKDRPYLRLDMDTFGREEFVSEKAKFAYDKLCEIVQDCATEEHTSPGDILFVNNFLCVHGRPPFRARFDGTDRWLQRLLLNSDFRKTAPFREDANKAVLYA